MARIAGGPVRAMKRHGRQFAPIFRTGYTLELLDRRFGAELLTSATLSGFSSLPSGLWNAPDVRAILVARPGFILAGPEAIASARDGDRRRSRPHRVQRAGSVPPAGP
jgi:hypothetical protein